MSKLRQLGNVYSIPHKCGSLTGCSAEIVAKTAEEALANLEEYVREHPDFGIEILGPPKVIVGDVWGMVA